MLIGAAVTVAGAWLASGAVLAAGLLVLLAGVLSPTGSEAADSARRQDAALAHRR